MKNASILLVVLLALVLTTSSVNGLRVKAMKGGDNSKSKSKSTSASKASRDKPSKSSRSKSSRSVSSIFCLRRWECTYFVIYFADMSHSQYSPYQYLNFQKSSRSSRSKSSSSSSSYSRSKRYYNACDSCSKRRNKSFCKDLWTNTCRFGSDISHEEKNFCKDVGLIPNPCKDEEERFFLDEEETVSIE